MTSTAALRLKRIAFSLFAVLAVVMAAATFIGQAKGTPFVTSQIYYSWWFFVLWAVMAGCGLAWLWHARPLRGKQGFVRRHAAIWCLHGSLALILLGAAVSFVTSWSGQVHLRIDEPAHTYLSDEGDHPEEALPFTLRLTHFDIARHSGTRMASDYTSYVEVGGKEYVVSMNRVPTVEGVRLYQSSYDSDGAGTILMVRSDRWGQPLTYTGYALLLCSFIFLLSTKGGGFRHALRMARGGAVALLFALPLLGAHAQNGDEPRALPKEVAEQFGRLYVSYGGRICPMQTLAQDFMRKVYGRPTWHGYTAEQVMTGWIFWPDDWNAAPIIQVKSRQLREELDVESKASFNDFFLSGYRLGPYLADDNDLHKAAAEVDDRMALIYSLRRGELFSVFPVTLDRQTVWIAPTEPDETFKRLNPEQNAFISNVFSRIFSDAQAGRYDDVRRGFEAIAGYQQANGGKTLPSEGVTKAERLYNALDLPTWLYRASLTLGLLLLIGSLRDKGLPRWARLTATGLGIIGFLALTGYIGLRTYVSGRLPLGNGFETMLAIAWLIGPVGALLWRSGRRLPMIYSMPFLAAGFFLLVASLSQASAQISQLMPVLNSPLLSAHVSIIMLAYALLSFTFLIALSALVRPQTAERARWQSLVILYPAVALLAVGIFLGAVWANVSWGRYWGWDPKEVWALITLMVYVLPLHSQSLPALGRPRTYHIYLALAFATVLMTYFGVNYYLTGLHSYA